MGPNISCNVGFACAVVLIYVFTVKIGDFLGAFVTAFRKGPGGFSDVFSGLGRASESCFYVTRVVTYTAKDVVDLLLLLGRSARAQFL